MHIEINDHTRLSEIEEVFSDFYPYLRLHFFRHPHEKYEASSESDKIFKSTTIEEIKQTHVSGLIEILPLYKVMDVEKEFQERFGLSVQILLKEKEGWVQTTGMDDFTLKELNEISRNASDDYILSDDEEREQEINR